MLRMAIVGLICICFSASSRADLIGLASLSTNDAYDGTLTDFQLGLAVGPDLLTGPYLLTGPLADGDSGRVFSFNSSSAHFSDIVAALTNGVDDNLEFAASIGGTPQMNISDFESAAFPPYLASGAVDFAGKTITDIEIEIVNVRLLASDPQTLVSYSATVRLYDNTAATIPSPAAIPLAFIGLSLVLLRRPAAW